MKDGIYLDLSEAEYHAIPALSASGIKNIVVSPLNFWANCPWLNPDYKDEPSDAMRIGKAFHKRILEGKEAFYGRYAQTFQASEGSLKTIEDLKGALADREIALPKKYKKEDLVELLRNAAPDAPIFDLEKLRYEEKHNGKEFLSSDLIKSIEIASAMIENHPQISKCFSGGYPEVSIVWTENSVRMKARIDYLKTRAICDLKTFGNPYNKPVERAIYGAMAAGKYHIQAAWYCRAVDSVKRGSRLKDIPSEWLERFTNCEEHDFYFVFQQKGIAPLARAYKFPRSSMFQIGNVTIEEGIRVYTESIKKYGDAPWVDMTEIGEFEDLLFPAWASE